MTNVLMLCGSLRKGSTNEAALRTARAVAPDGLDATLYAGMGDLPHFNPDDDREPLHPAVADLRAAIGAADALLICTPEYAGALPGSFKNLLDWTIGGGEIYEKPVAWLNVASPAAPTGGGDAHASLRKVLGYAGTEIVEAACARIPVIRPDVGEDGLVRTAEPRARLREAVEALHAALRP
ncbi:NADPH-dependent FMN reductase [Actinomadura citrea]|uniref:NAD(P)H-dependent FMN reductase n=1 Tax=Actinomadura citrea TaxID=46158 RepID=A0A7Y9GF01_9ACTN|nr:NADPH-dependent FMN reductase [Actinomadura citrea]NYE15161.1 NAD(P)H-dependent FMN reductase [Actinomadura citrea]GGT93857.1 FMN reductase [Actinomadura citrea]